MSFLLSIKEQKWSTTLVSAEANFAGVLPYGGDTSTNYDFTKKKKKKTAEQMG